MQNLDWAKGRERQWTLLLQSSQKESGLSTQRQILGLQIPLERFHCLDRREVQQNIAIADAEPAADGAPRGFQASLHRQSKCTSVLLSPLRRAARERI